MIWIKKTFFYYVEKFPNCTEVRFASFLSGGFTTMVVINPPEKKLAKIILYALVPWVPYVDIIKELGLSTHVFYTIEVCKKE